MKNLGITLLGLGPGDPDLLTRQAWQVLISSGEIYLRTRLHPTVIGFPPELRVHSFDRFYEEGNSFDEVYERIIEQILELGQEESGVVYGVPGHPYVAEATAPEITRRAKMMGIPVTLVEGLSFIEPIFGLLGIDPFPHTAFVDALELVTLHHPPFPPDFPAVIAQIHSPGIASDVKLTLLAVYPDDHQVQLVHGAGTSSAKVELLKLYEIDRSSNIGLLTALYLPGLDQKASFEGFQDVVAHLRAPDGCPWDRDQTHLSLRPYLLEEAYEVLTALDNEDQKGLQEELGDLLLQIVLHAQIASEYGDFSMVDVIHGISEKLVHRHPHVFGDLEIHDQKKVVENWQKLKSAEREVKPGKNGILDGVSPALPALVQAETYQERVNRVGFDWVNVQGVFAKITEEIAEIQNADSDEEYEAEIGDLLFAVVNLARWLDIDAESALRAANNRFRMRFEKIEAAARKGEREISELTLEELDELWDAAKKN
ncbi:MAG: nucleoside triphosphate pyrophosphohydrolase [Chloroflexota bacterium]|nr:MAG: nucleoside triphosphate pyrophosphohydrolase [Chloroflexota bacterium]